MNRYFIALEPEEQLIQKINDQKQFIFDQIGKQKYLDQPVHITLFVFTTDKIEKICTKIDSLYNKINEFLITLKDYHIFYDDPLTNGHTITYSLDEPAIKRLKKLQNQIIEEMNGLHTKNLISLDSKAYAALDASSQLNVQKYGFPFVGLNWIPHITLGSIQKDLFERIYLQLQKPTNCTSRLSHLAIYTVDDAKPELVKRWNLHSQ